MVLSYLILSNYVATCSPELHLPQIQCYTCNTLNIAESFRLQKFMRNAIQYFLFGEFSINNRCFTFHPLFLIIN